MMSHEMKLQYFVIHSQVTSVLLKHFQFAFKKKIHFVFRRNRVKYQVSKYIQPYDPSVIFHHDSMPI
jgi:hypothetical protein